LTEDVAPRLVFLTLSFLFYQTVSWFNIKVEEMFDNSEKAFVIQSPCALAMQKNIALMNRLDQLAVE
jgi:hypothetical protein